MPFRNRKYLLHTLREKYDEDKYYGNISGRTKVSTQFLWRRNYHEEDLQPHDWLFQAHGFEKLLAYLFKRAREILET